MTGLRPVSDPGHDAGPRPADDARPARGSGPGRRLARLALDRALACAVLVPALSLLVFGLAALSPLDPLRAYLGDRVERLTEQDRAAAAAALGLDAPWWRAWADWLAGLAHGDLGVSRLAGEPVAAVLAERLPLTAGLGLSAWLLAAVGALGLALAAARQPHGRLDRAVRAAAVGLQAVPPLVLTVVLVTALLATGLLSGPAARAAHLAGRDVAPAAAAVAAVVLALGQLPWLVTALREELGRAAAAPDALAAVARGLPAGVVLREHALPAAAPAALAVLGQRLPGVVTGTLLVETVLGLPGLGEATVRAALGADVALLAAVAVLGGLLAVLGSALADGAAVLLDPRAAA